MKNLKMYVFMLIQHFYCAYLRSKAMNKTKRRFGANLQKVRILVDGEPKKVWVSARALKSGKVERV